MAGGSVQVRVHEAGPDAPWISDKGAAEVTAECQIHQHLETRPSRRCTCGSLYCEGTFIPPRSIPPLLPESLLGKGFPAAPTSCCQLHRCPPLFLPELGWTLRIMLSALCWHQTVRFRKARFALSACSYNTQSRLTRRQTRTQTSRLSINQPRSCFQGECGLRPCWWSNCGPKSGSASITLGLVRNAQYRGHRSIPEAESTLYQDPQVICLHLKAREGLGSRRCFSFMKDVVLWRCFEVTRSDLDRAESILSRGMVPSPVSSGTSLTAWSQQEA